MKRIEQRLHCVVAVRNQGMFEDFVHADIGLGRQRRMLIDNDIKRIGEKLQIV